MSTLLAPPATQRPTTQPPTRVPPPPAPRVTSDGAAQYDSLPGLPFPAPADTHPSKDDVADHLAAHARHLHLPVQLNSPRQHQQRRPQAVPP